MNAQNPILETIAKNDRAVAGTSLPEGLISADSHITEPPHCYTAYIDPKYRDRAPHVEKDPTGGDVFVIDGYSSTVPLSIVAAAGIDPRDIRLSERKFEDLHRGGWDPKARVADQDRDGVIAEVIYPSVGMVLCNHPDADYKQACMWAYNRWLQEEFVSGAPHRLIGVGQTAVRSVKEAVEDLHRFSEMGFRGVMLPGNPETEQDYDDASFDPLWRAAVELDMPISFHILTSRSDGSNAVGSAGKRASAWRGPPQNIANTMINSIQDIVGTFIWGRVFERHPQLQLICVEADAGWAPHYSYRLDHIYSRHRFWMKLGEMPKPPSAYFAQNVKLTFQDDAVAFNIAEMLDPGQLLWANDFPHSDSTWPWSRDLLKVLTANVDDATKARILRDNTAALYGIDVSAGIAVASL